VQFPSILKSHDHIAGSKRGRITKGECGWNIHFNALNGMPGAAQGVLAPHEICPPLA
jgi:hypothetical protein